MPAWGWAGHSGRCNSRHVGWRSSLSLTGCRIPGACNLWRQLKPHPDCIPACYPLESPLLCVYGSPRCAPLLCPCLGASGAGICARCHAHFRMDPGPRPPRELYVGCGDETGDAVSMSRRWRVAWLVRGRCPVPDACSSGNGELRSGSSRGAHGRQRLRELRAGCLAHAPPLHSGHAVCLKLECSVAALCSVGGWRGRGTGGLLWSRGYWSWVDEGCVELLSFVGWAVKGVGVGGIEGPEEAVVEPGSRVSSGLVGEWGMGATHVCWR